MGKVKFILASVLLFVIAFSHGVNSVEGRHLKIGKTKVSNKKPITPTKTETASRKVGENNSTFRGDHASKTLAHLVSKEFKPAAALVQMRDKEATNPAVPLDDSRSPLLGHVEDFRPTDPGHSPGIGHSVHN